MNQQKLMLGPMPVPGMRHLPSERVKRCRTMRDALVLCWYSSPIHYTEQDIADAIGVSGKGTVSKYLSGKIDIPAARIPALERLCRNYAVTQWLAYTRGLQVVYTSADDDALAKTGAIERRAQMRQAA